MFSRKDYTSRVPRELQPAAIKLDAGSYPVLPVKSHFEQVHRVSFDHESNLVKTPFYWMYVLGQVGT
jgi:hypothetical protein